ncbi:MAG TPA: hypothetical protein VEH08_00650 [Methanomassiliicoccales archaeon]|nr:hypothetical protein [Methanomassiliicoccales archaeon]
MIYTTLEKTEAGYVHAVKQGKKVKRVERPLSMIESFKAVDDRFRSIRPIVRR